MWGKSFGARATILLLVAVLDSARSDLWTGTNLARTEGTIDQQLAATCSDGTVGLERNGQCCKAECGQCGGRGCRQAARNAGLTPDDCCTSRIADSNQFCALTGAAPCTIEAPTCSDGTIGIEKNDVCCHAGCGSCGGRGCRSRAEEAGLTASDCCRGAILDDDVACGQSQNAPCVIKDIPPPTPAPSTMAPTDAPSLPPTTPAPSTSAPTDAPSAAPSTSAPTVAPSLAPTDAPTYAPSFMPTPAPTYVPTPGPTDAPTPGPTFCG